MFSTEFRYKLNNLRRILKKATVQLIRILFILASVATIVLMAYEYGYAISEAGEKIRYRGIQYHHPDFLFRQYRNDLSGSQRDLARERILDRDYRISTFVIRYPDPNTGSFSHRQLVTKNRSYPDPYSLVVYKHHPSLESGSYGITTAYKT